MLDSYLIETLEQLKALTHPLRMKIVELLVEKPMTTKQIAKALGENPLKLYYHVAALEKARLIELVETRMKVNLQEKYYQAVAKTFKISEALLGGESREVADTVTGLLNNLLKILRDEILQSPLTSPAQPQERKEYTVIGTHEHIRVSQQAIEQLAEKISALLKEAKQAEKREGELSYCLAVLFFPLQEPQRSLNDSGGGPN